MKEIIERLPPSIMPERIYLDPQNPWNGKNRVLGFIEGNKDDFEYIRSDIAEQMAKEFAEWRDDGHYKYKWGRIKGEKRIIPVKVDIAFTEFINSRKK